jgi:hypothetical protein
VLDFYAVPAWQLVPGSKKEEVAPLRPTPPDFSLIAKALEGVEYRGDSALIRAQQLVAQQAPALFASSPNDLPALLRTADQLLGLARQRAGERAQVWTCRCGARYAVPVVFVRPITLPCERCGSTVELDPGTSLGDTAEEDPQGHALSETRRTLSEFFHEAMARGWPVMVTKR